MLKKLVLVYRVSALLVAKFSLLSSQHSVAVARKEKHKNKAIEDAEIILD